MSENKKLISMSRHTRLLWFLLFFFLISNALASVKTIHPYVGDLQQFFTELAQTRLQTVYSIIVPVSGVLKRVELPEGTIVKRNQAVAQMNQEPLINAVKSAKEDMETFKYWYDLRVKILHRQEALFSKGYATRQELDQAQAYVAMLDAQVKKDEAALKTAQYNLQKSTMKSPIDGIVLKRYTQGGMWVLEGSPILDIGDLKNMEVFCDVLTEDAQLLQVGGKAILTSIGSSKTLFGAITRIEPNAFTKKSALGVDEQRVNIIMKINGDPRSANLGVGYRLQAKFLIGSPITNALLIPRYSILQNTKGQYYVIKKQRRKLQKQLIIIAGKTDELAAVVRGLTAADEIIAEPTADM